MKKVRKIGTMFLLVIILTAIPVFCFADEKANVTQFGQNGEYGSVYGSERNPAKGDTSKWLTIQNGENGTRIVSNDGKELVAVDNHGGIYLNGDLYLNNKKFDPNQKYTVNGFMYLLIMTSLTLNVYLISSHKKHQKQIDVLSSHVLK